MRRLLFHTINVTLSFLVILVTLYSLLFVRIHFNDLYMPPLCRVQTTTFIEFNYVYTRVIGRVCSSADSCPGQPVFTFGLGHSPFVILAHALGFPRHADQVSRNHHCHLL